MHYDTSCDIIVALGSGVINDIGKIISKMTGNPYIIVATAPAHMSKSGLGDMLAKYVSICEWRISNLINGEYYCEKVADCVRLALKKCVDNAYVGEWNRRDTP